MSALFNDPLADAVLSALAKPEFKWRTVRGVSKDTGLPQEVVMKVLAQNTRTIVKSSVQSPDGQDLYATRQHFRETGSASEKLLGAIRNRAV